MTVPDWAPGCTRWSVSNAHPPWGGESEAGTPQREAGPREVTGLDKATSLKPPGLNARSVASQEEERPGHARCAPACHGVGLC